MPVPTSPLRLQVIDRIVTVLKAITAGATYFYTPYDVTKRMVHYREVGGFPFYMVHADASAGSPEQHLDSEYVETMAVSVKGFVNTELGEAITKLEKCLRDVRKAIADDAKSNTAGSLGNLSVSVDIDTVETDNGYLSLEGFGFFDQRVLVRIMGDWGEI